MSHTIRFFNGFEMPLIGWKGKLGCSVEETEATLESALEIGYRHIDTTYEAQNESAIGRVLKKFFDDEKLAREEIFVTAKLPAIGNTAVRVEHFMKKSLENLQLDYVDLYLIESPVGFNYIDDDTCYPLLDGQIDLDRHTDLVKIYKSMELLVDEGLTKSIGLSNFNSRQLKLLIKNARIQPANLQVECHPYLQQKELRQVCQKYEVSISTFIPFACSEEDKKALATHRGFDLINHQLRSIPLNDLAVRKVAEKRKKTCHQILLRFLHQNNIPTIVTPTTIQSSQEYFNIFDFELSDKDSDILLNLDKGREGRTFDLAHVIKELSQNFKFHQYLKDLFPFRRSVF